MPETASKTVRDVGGAVAVGLAGERRGAGLLRAGMAGQLAGWMEMFLDAAA
jgi:hypothetical protein